MASDQSRNCGVIQNQTLPRLLISSDGRAHRRSRQMALHLGATILGSRFVTTHFVGIRLARRGAADPSGRDRGRRLTQACLPVMRAQRWGRIIHITGSSGPSGINATNPVKAAVHVWSKGFSRVVGRDGITVNCLAPGRIHSEQIDQRIHPTAESQQTFAAQIPLGYFGEPAGMAFLVACLCSPKARYITGERIDVDGGYRRAY